MKRLLLNLFYEAWLSAIVTYYRTIKFEKKMRKEAVAQQLHLNRQEYIEVSNMCLLLFFGAIFIYLFFICHVCY